MAKQTEKTTLLLASVTLRILKPLANILLRNGVSYAFFAETAKRAFIEAAENEYEAEKKKHTISSISTITGLTRKEVSRIKNQPETVLIDDDNPLVNRAARVISGWLNNKAYQDKKGSPATLALEGEKNSFADLVKNYSGDMTVKSILDELIRIGTVDVTEKKQVKLLKHAYIPKHDNNKKLEILGQDVAGLINSINHNLICEPENLLFQRKSTYKHIPTEKVETLKKELFTQAQLSLENIDQTLCHYNNNDTNEDTQQVSMGIYYFEETKE